MSNLDQRDYLLRHDPKGMYDLFHAFPEQCELALKITKEVPLPTNATPDHCVLTGMGGSAAGGDFLKCIFDDAGKVPFIVNRDYNLPNYVKAGSLVFATSYSGNTEETLAAYDQAKKVGASIICVTSGGKLAEKAKADGYPLIVIPGGQPPRTALGFMLIPVVYACQKLGLIPEQDFERLFALLKDIRTRCEVEVGFSQNESKTLATAIFGRLSLVYGLGGWQLYAANRWKGQINENSKNHTFINTFPELNHNEILAWMACDKQGVADYVILNVGDGSESAKILRRKEISMELIGDKAEKIDITVGGSTILEKMLSFCYLGDFVSIYLAALNDVDPEDIEWLHYLKAELAKVN